MHGECFQHVTKVPLIISSYYTKVLDDFSSSYAVFLTCSSLTRIENKGFQGQTLSKFAQTKYYDVVFVKGYKMSPSLLQLDNHIKSYRLNKILENPSLQYFKYSNKILNRTNMNSYFIWMENNFLNPHKLQSIKKDLWWFLNKSPKRNTVGFPQIVLFAFLLHSIASCLICIAFVFKIQTSLKKFQSMHLCMQTQFVLIEIDLELNLAWLIKNSFI